MHFYIFSIYWILFRFFFCVENRIHRSKCTHNICHAVLHSRLCVAVCCSVLQCAEVCCSVWQCVAVCCSVLRRVAVCCSVLLCVIAHLMLRTPACYIAFSVLRCDAYVAVCCSVLQYVVVSCVAVSCTVLHSVFLPFHLLVQTLVWSSVLQCVAVRCSELLLHFLSCLQPRWERGPLLLTYLLSNDP